MEKNKKPGQVKSVKSVLKGAVKNTTVLVMSTALVTYPLDFPYVNAYFTDKIVYSEDGRISGKRTFTTMSKGVVELYFDIHTFNDLKVDFSVQFVDDILIAEMNLPDDCGFNAEDIIMDSLELTYDNETIDISPIEVQTRGQHIVLKYDWSKIESFIDIDDYTPALDISGKGRGMGKSGLGEKFIFKGSGRLPDLQKEFYEQMKDSFYLDGLLNITVPTAEEGQQVYSYKLYLDGREVPVDEVEWELLSEISGVRLEAGKLIVESGAEKGPISIRATLKSNKYFKYEIEIELIKTEEEIQEIIEEIPENQEEIPDADEIEGEQPEEPSLDPEDQEDEDISLPSDPTDDKLSDDKDEEDNSEGHNNEDETDTDNEGENEGSDDEAYEDKDEDETDPGNEGTGNEGDNTDIEDNSEDENDNSPDDNTDNVDDLDDDNMDEDEETGDENEEPEDENSDGLENSEDESDLDDENNADDEESTEDEDIEKENSGDETAENQEEEPAEELEEDIEEKTNSSDYEDESYEDKLDEQDKTPSENVNDKSADSINKNLDQEAYTDE